MIIKQRSGFLKYKWVEISLPSDAANLPSETDTIATDSDSEDILLFSEAAEQDYADAQYNLGIMYYEGRGVAQNYFQAYKWLSISAKLGISKEKLSEIKELIDTLEKRVGAAQIVEAKKQVNQWKK